jgi:hypothetical protein
MDAIWGHYNLLVFGKQFLPSNSSKVKQKFEGKDSVKICQVRLEQDRMEGDLRTNHDEAFRFTASK